MPKGVNVPQLPKKLLSSGTEGKPDFPLQVRPIYFCGTKKETVRKSGQFTNTSSFASGERRLKSKKKSRLAAGDAPVQVTTLSIFGNYQKLLVISLYLVRSDSRLARSIALLYGIRSEPKTALFVSQPLQNRSGLSELFSLKG